MQQMSEEQRKRGCVSASAGNHAQAMCWHGLQLGVPITVVMPVIAPLMKIQKCKDMKGNVIVQGANMAEAKEIAMKIAYDSGATYVNGLVIFIFSFDFLCITLWLCNGGLEVQQLHMPFKSYWRKIILVQRIRLRKRKFALRNYRLKLKTVLPYL